VDVITALFSDLSRKILGNSIKTYIFSLGLFLLLVVAFRILQSIIINRLIKLSKKTKTDLDDHLVKIVASVKPPIYTTFALFVALKTLSTGPFFDKVLTAGLYLILTYQAILAISILVEYVSKKYVRRNGDDAERSAIKLITNIVKGILWLIGALIIVQNLGVNVTSLVAGLGIGGVAIAFALQSILEDLFSSFAIIFDKPFKEGDFIIIGNDMGVVEKIGIKTTRMKALQGEELIISNKELTSSRIQNFKKMEERRVPFRIGVTYDTSNSKLKAVPSYVEKIINKQKNIRFDRAHFVEYGDSALIFEIVYYVLSADYNEYMDINQAIYLGIKEKFEKEKIEFAFPTQTVYLEK